MWMVNKIDETVKAGLDHGEDLIQPSAPDAFCRG